MKYKFLEGKYFGIFIFLSVYTNINCQLSLKPIYRIISDKIVNPIKQTQNRVTLIEF